MSSPDAFRGVPWLEDLLDVPDDAAWPRHMSPVHPAAVGSYGAAVEAWAAEALGMRLRWWQRLALRRQLEHDADGALVWRTVVESGPRRIGKSVRLRVGALWRMAHPDLFGEPQLVLHTGRDLAIAREIHRQGWRYAEEVAGWTVTRANGKEAIETPAGDRWLVRAVAAVYGYDVCLGYVDEAWDVAPDVVDEGLEPGTMERRSPQVVLTSTAHRRATSLMRRRITSALAGLGEDWETLLLLWGAGPRDDPGDPVVWRAASPHWSQDRARMVAGKFERAMRGEADAEADDPDPIEGFRAQYLNVWPSSDGPPVTGDPVVEAGEWGRLVVEDRPERGRGPVVVGVEAWFGEGVAVAAAELLPDGRARVEVETFASLSDAAPYVGDLRGWEVLAGKSLAKDPALRDALTETRAEPVGGTSRQAMLDLRRLVDDRAIAHDGGEELTRQVLGMRSSLGAGGARLVSRTRMDAVKAAVWAAGRVRQLGEMPAVF